MRTAKSSTYRDASGGFVTRIAETPVNFKDASGVWQRIDTGLDDNGTDRIHNDAGPVAVGLPTELRAEPVRVAHGDEWVSFDPAGLTDATGAITGSSVSYPGVAEDMRAVYEALPTGLKETLVLGSGDAPSRYRYAIDSSDGLSARLADDGSIEFARSNGSVAFVMATPTVQEHGGVPTTDHIRFVLAADHRSVDVIVDAAWLASADFPVKVDPGTTLANALGCSLVSGTSAAVSSCAGALDAGVDSSSRAHRAIDRFDVAGAAIPRDASVMWALIHVKQTAFTGTGSLDLGLYRLNHSFTSGATWNKYDGTNAWATAGGDVPTTAESRLTATASTTNTTLNFPVAALAQGWIDQSITNNGVLIRGANETTKVLASLGNSTSSTTRPTLEIFWTLRTGLRAENRFVTAPLSSRSTASVNVANGNLVLRATDFSFAGGFDYTRTYNTRDEGWGGTNGILWDNEAGFGTGVRLMRNDEDNSYAYKAPGGAWYRFDRNPSGDAALTGGDLAYNSPLGLNVKLVQHTNKFATMTDQATGTRYEFDRYDYGGYLLSKTDSSGHTISYGVRNTNDANDRDQLAAITDPTGHVSQVHYPSATYDRADYVTDSTGAQWKYTYDSSENLTKVTAPDAKTQSYTYGPYHTLATATSDTGQLVVFTYDSQYNQITQMRQVVNGTATTVGTQDKTTSFDYTPQGTNPCPATDPNNSSVPVIGRTDVTGPDGIVSTYCYTRTDEVVKVIDRTPPTAPTGIVLSSYDPDQADAGAIFNWDLSTDPAFPDGTPGSGVDHYSYRYKVGSGAFSTATDTSAAAATLTGLTAGTSVTLEVKAVDGAGNVSPATATTTTLVTQLEDPAVQQMAVNSYAAQYSVTQSVAQSWMSTQDSAAIAGRKIATAYTGAGYAGTWFDNTARRFKVMLKAGSDTTQANSIVAQYGLGAQTDLISTTYSQRQLEDAQPGITTQLDDLVQSGLIQISRVTSENAIHIDVASTATAAQLSRVQQTAAAASVRVNVQSVSDANFTNETYAGLEGFPLRGGTRVYQSSGVYCTAGFIATQSTGEPVVLTAGHCVSENTSLDWYSKKTTTMAPAKIGAASSYVDDSTGDVGLIDIAGDSDWRVGLGNYIRVTSPKNLEYAITAVATGQPGRRYCLTSADTGSECGELTDNDADFLAGRPGETHALGRLQLDRSSCKAYRGSSGGPIFKGHTAYGTIVGGNKAKCLIWFEGAEQAQKLLNMTIRTR